MFADILNRKERVPSARETQKRQDYLDTVLGKLPEISSQRGASRNGKYIKDAISDRKSEASTAYKTELSVQTKPLVEDVDADKKSPADEQDYWQWHEKKLECLKLPVYKPPPATCQRSFSSERRNRQVKALSEQPYSDDESSDDALSQQNMNKTAYAILQTPSKKKNGEEEEEEEDELMSVREKYYEEKYARKGRWIVKVEKEDERTSRKASIASMNASSCNAAINKTFTAPDAYNVYKTQQKKLNNTMLANLSVTEQKEADKKLRGRRLITAALAASQQPRMTSEEYKVWRSEAQKKRFGNTSLPRWRGGTTAKAAVDTTGNFTKVPIIKKRPVQKAKTPDRYSFAPKPVRDMIQKNRDIIVERVKLLQAMNADEDDE